jgi:hypothetical protein
MSDATLPHARHRFGAVAAALAAMPEPVAIRTGFAELTADETARELIARADSQLIDSHRADQTPEPRRPATARADRTSASRRRRTASRRYARW